MCIRDSPRSSFYRRQRPLLSPAAPSVSARSLRPAERESVLSCLHEERFQDRSPAAVYATLLDEGRYHCSIRTMYRLLAQEGESRERRDQLAHPPYQKPELLATAPNQLWSWDITKPVSYTHLRAHETVLDLVCRLLLEKKKKKKKK